MELEALKSYLLGGSGILFVLLTLVQISPIKINPWSFLARRIGRAINKEVMDQMTEFKTELKDVRQDMEDFRQESNERDATLCRARFLRFGDEILHGTPHSKEHYNQILADISTYEHYCANHPMYKNNVAIETISYIEKKYQEHLIEDTFLK